jgi:hypothetical protein
MHGKKNSYSEISAVLGIPRSICNDIVQRFGMSSDLKDRHSHGRPQVLKERGDCEVIRVLNDSSNRTPVVVGKESWSQGFGSER